LDEAVDVVEAFGEETEGAVEGQGGGVSGGFERGRREGGGNGAKRKGGRDWCVLLTLRPRGIGGRAGSVGRPATRKYGGRGS